MLLELINLLLYRILLANQKPNLINDKQQIELVWYRLWLLKDIIF